MAEIYARVIPISRRQFERLEELLEAAERFGTLEPQTLVLYTPHGKRLTFQAPTWTPRERRLKDLMDLTS